MSDGTLRYNVLSPRNTPPKPRFLARNSYCLHLLVSYSSCKVRFGLTPFLEEMAAKSSCVLDVFSYFYFELVPAKGEKFRTRGDKIMNILQYSTIIIPT